MENISKRICALLLAATITLSIFSGCNKTEEATKDQPSNNTPTNTTQTNQTTEEATPDGWVKVTNIDGPVLGYMPESGVSILTVDGKAFKDLNKNGELDTYEDWRLTVDERAQALAKEMTVEEIAGLMLYSVHSAIESAELTDVQRTFLTDDNVRAVLVTKVSSKTDAAKWNNNAQALVESSRLGIPINSSSDPRNSAGAGEAYSSGAGEISMWPSNLGMAATFNPELMKEFGYIASKEYRALGIGTALSPQIDLATEPRWLRANGTFGEDTQLAIDMTKAYADGFQTTQGEENGWGYDSVNAMIKHWPGDGTGENGRESHLYSGKYAVYPGDNFEEHIRPFVEGGLQLEGPTGAATAVMSSYSIAYDENNKYGDPVGSGFSQYKIQELLRDKYGYDGVVCTDWLIFGNEGVTDNLTVEKDGLYQPGRAELFAGWGISWGLEYNNSVVDRFYKAIQAGIDQFGGVNTSVPVIKAYEMGVEEIGEEAMRARFEQSAVRLLRNIFNLNIFENPYLDIANSEAVIGNEEFMQAGYNAQLESVIMLKNKGGIIGKPAAERKTVYIPQVYIEPVMSIDPAKGTYEETEPAKIQPALNVETVEKYFNVVTDEVETAETAKPEDIKRNTNFENVDFAIIAIDSPDAGSLFAPAYLKTDKRNFDPAAGPIDNGIYPISLQYRPYTAPDNEHTHTTIAVDPTEEAAWIAAGGEAGTSRSYAGKTIESRNEKELDLVLATKKAVGDLPVVVFVRAKNAFVPAEFEQAADAILMGFGVSDQAILEVIAGNYEPTGLLPVQMPEDMATVEANKEDVGKDMIPYTDSEGNAYDFAFGMNWSGPIKDARTDKYGAK